MFKQGSCANEVAEAMVANLERNKPVFQASISKIASAIDTLAADADAQGHSDEAEHLTSLIERIAGFQDLTLSPEDRLFFDKLPEHHKTHLKRQSPKEFADEVRKLRMAHEVVEEMERRDKPNPEVIEFESLLPRGKQLPESSFPQDVIEFESLKADDPDDDIEDIEFVEKPWRGEFGPDDPEDMDEEAIRILMENMRRGRGDNHVSDMYPMHAEVIKAPKEMKHSASVKEAFAELRAGAPKKKAH